MSLVPLVLALSNVEGLFSGSTTYLFLTLHEVRSDKPFVSSILLIGADQK